MISSPHPDSEIAAIIAARRGRERAVSIEEIGLMLWPERWQCGGPEGELARKNIARAVKAAVARIVNSDRMVIVASRGKPCGYFVPVEKREIDRAARTSVRQAVKMLKRADRLTGSHAYEKMCGQLELQWEGL